MLVSVRTRARSSGVTLVELLVAMTLSVLIVMASVALYSVTSSSSNTSTEDQGIQDNGRFALRMISDAVRQAGFVNYAINSVAGGGNPTPIQVCNAATCSAIEGADNATITGAVGIDNIGTSGSRASTDLGGDSIGLRFQPGGVGDNSIIDCLGRSVTSTVSIFGSTPQAANDLVLSAFFVMPDTDAEPSLWCSAANSVGSPTNLSRQIVRGVETLHVLYGYDTNGDSIADKWLSATEVVAAAASPWAQVVAVRVGMVVRGAPGSAQQRTGVRMYPLGVEFAPAVTFDPPADGRLRKTFVSTFQLRNPPNWGN